MDKFERYITSIKRKYRERLIDRENQWPPCKSNKLVRLELVEGEKGEVYYARHMRGQERKDIKRTPLKYDDLFEVASGKKPVRKVLVEGDAGIGKTTLSIAICEDWANDMLFQQFKMLLLLPLRHQEVASVGSLPEMLKLLHLDKVLCKEVSEYLIVTEGDEVLIIADGWDEITSRHQLNESFLYKLLFKRYLPFASVIITSRYSASAEFHKQSLFDRFVEITGFDKENITHYIQSEFANESRKCDDLKEQLEANPLVESVCSVPLNCAIICHLWRLNSREALPTTMTELYSKIIRNVVFRNIEKDANNSTNVSRLSSFDDLPEDLKQPWNYLCKFAFETMAKGQIIFSGDELNKLEAAHNNRIFSFGLLQESLFLLDDGYGRSYHFLHRTFQEFLAAFHLAKLASESIITATVEEVFQTQEHSRTIYYGDFEIVWRFLFGIYFNVLKCHNCHAILPYMSRIYGWYKDGHCNSADNRSLCHFAFEAKNDFIYKDIIQAVLMNGHGSLYSHSAHDCAAIIDIISHMQDCKIDVNFGNCGVRQHQIDCLGEVLNNCKNVWIENLNLNGNKLVSVETLFSAAPNNFQSLRKLDLGNNMIKTVNFMRSPFNWLRNIDLSNNPLGINGMNILQTAIAGDSLTNLSSLYLDNCLTRDTYDIDSTQFSKFLRALSAHCPNLSKLDLSQNNLGVTGALELAKVKSEHNKVNSSWLRWVNLSQTNLSDEGLRSFTKAIDCACYFTALQLDGNDIHATGLRYLVEASGSGKICFPVRSPNEVLKLELEDNPLGLGGLAEIGKLLSSNQSQLMTVLSLNRCQLTDRLTHDQDVCNELLIGQQLCQMPHNNMLYSLSMDGNKFTGDGIHILAGLMHLCLSLMELDTKDCAISSSDFSQLLDKLAQFRSSGAPYCHELDSWDLSSNDIDDEVVPAITKHELSPLFPKLRWISLTGNRVSDEVELTIFRKLNGKLVRIHS